MCSAGGLFLRFFTRIVGIQQALEWVYTADAFDAGEAPRGRRVKAVYPAEQLLDEARNSAQPIRRRLHRMDSLAMFHTSIGDGKDGGRSFMEKRVPEFASRVSTGLPLFYKSGAGDRIDPRVGLKVGSCR